MSEFSQLPNRLIKGLSRLCAGWVNPGVTDPDLRARDASLVGAIFGLPLVTSGAALLRLGDVSRLQEILPLLSLTFAGSMISAGLLALTGSNAIRRILAASAVPAYWLAVSQGLGFHIEAALASGLFAGFARRFGMLKPSDLRIGAMGAAVLAAFAGPAALAASLIAGLFSFAVSGTSRNEADAQAPRDDEKVRTGDDTLAQMIAGENTFVLQADRSGKFAAVLGFPAAFGARQSQALSDHIHVADRVAVLTALDGACAGLAPQQNIEARFKVRSADGSTGFQPVRLSIAAVEGKALIVGHAATPAVEQAPHVSPLLQASHEMRTPLNAIVGFSDLLESGMCGELTTPRQREYVELINRSGRHLLDLVNAMLDVSKVENGSAVLESTPFLPDEVASLAINMLAKQAQARHIGLDYIPMCIFEAFHGDRRICQQIIVNLLSNAVKFTPDGGRVGLTVDIIGDRLMIEVTDSGIGMTESEIARAGTPFYQAANPMESGAKGNGLGLSLVRQMTRQHGGTVEITSTSGEGTCVRVSLARINRSHDSAANISVLRPPVGNEAARIISISEEPLHDAPRKTA